MKNYCFYFVTLALLFTFNQSPSQNLIQPITISPLIGNTLDPLEKRFFNLPPPIMGFTEAKFYLNTDSSITAKMYYSLNDVVSDTILEKYYSLKSFRNYLITKTIEYMNNNQQSKMDFYLNDNSMITASLYKVNESSVSFIKPNIRNAIKAGNLNEYMLELKSEQVSKIAVQEGVTVWPYALGGTLIGMIAGGAIGGSLVSNETDNVVEAVFAKPMEKSVAILLGGLIGAAAGLAIGLVIGNNITTDVEFVAHPISGYSILEKRALLNSVTGDK